MSFPEAEAPRALSGESVDAFQNGAFELVQPLGTGLRGGLDALLLAAFVRSSQEGRVADLGAGTGAVGFSAAVRAAGVEVRLVERDRDLCGLLARSMDLPGNAAFAARLGIVSADILGARADREAAGLCDACFDLVLTNPPFHPHRHRASPDPARRAAKSEAAAGDLQRWIAVSATLLRHSGALLAILRPEGLAAILATAPNRLGDIAVLPVHTRPHAAAKRIVVAARRGSRAPLRILPGLWLCDPDGSPSAASRAIAAGTFDGAPLLG